MITNVKAPKSPKIVRKSVKNFLNGVVTALDDGRTPLEGLRSSGNVILEQDGVVRPRPSKVLYGPQPTGTVLGEIFEFKNVVNLTSTNWMISLQNVSGTTKVYIAKGEDTSWTVCNGYTYDNSASAHFLQVGNKVLVMNGTDSLSYLDIATSTVIPFTALSTPSAPTLTTLTGLTGTTYTIYYAITANSSVGETDGSAVLSQQVSTDRDFWNPSTQSVKISWSAVTNARDYNVYMGISATGAGTPILYLIASGVNGLSYTDNGSAAQYTTHPIPTYNSTAGVKASRGAVINGRPWLVGIKDAPYLVYYGGDYNYELDFTPVNGGGFVPVGSGTKELPVAIKQFRDGKGTPQITVLCQGTNGRGKRYILTPDSLTVGSTVINFYAVNEDNGQDGTDSPDGVIVYQDDVHYPSRDGFKTTGTLPQLQNVLSTRRSSNTIQGDIKTLSSANMNKCVGLGFEGRLYWALPVGSTTNNEIWVLDLDRKGAWMKPLSISANWMWLYNDNSGTTHFCVLSNNKVCELSYASLTNDLGTAFTTQGNSGQIYFSDDGREWGKLIQVVFVLLRPQGAISFSVSGKTEDTPLAVVGTGSFIPQYTQAGWSEAQSGWSDSSWGYLRGWSEINVVPSVFNPATQEVTVEVDEDLQWYSYGWTTTDSGVDYALADVIGEYVNTGVRDLS